MKIVVLIEKRGDKILVSATAPYYRYSKLCENFEVKDAIREARELIVSYGDIPEVYDRRLDELVKEVIGK